MDLIHSARGSLTHRHFWFVLPLATRRGGSGGEAKGDVQHLAPSRVLSPTSDGDAGRTVVSCLPASARPPCSASTPTWWTSRPTSRTGCPPSPPWGCRRAP